MDLTDKPIGARGRRNAKSVAGPTRRSRPPRTARAHVTIAGLAALALACAPPAPREPAENSLRVTVSAYNSTRAQTNDMPTLAAWGDTLRPGMRVIAVSRDLIPLGLDHGTLVRIEGIEGPYVVRDKMAARWERKIDIYMGDDVAAAREWGTRELTIYWVAD